MMPPAVRKRLSADERREQVVAAATAEFAERGFHGASTERVARRAGISHAYVFRLFPTKRDLFIASAGGCGRRVRETFRAAAAAYERGETPQYDSVLTAMGKAYLALLQDRELLRAQLQTWALCASDPDVRRVAQDEYGAVFADVQRLSGADPDTARAFLAQGMLLTVAAALSLDERADEPWVRSLLPHLAPAGDDA